jgi:hypothetical protein
LFGGDPLSTEISRLYKKKLDEIFFLQGSISTDEEDELYAMCEE